MIKKNIDSYYSLLELFGYLFCHMKNTTKALIYLKTHFFLDR